MAILNAQNEGKSGRLGGNAYLSSSRALGMARSHLSQRVPRKSSGCRLGLQAKLGKFTVLGHLIKFIVAFMPALKPCMPRKATESKRKQHDRHMWVWGGGRGLVLV